MGVAKRYTIMWARSNWYGKAYPSPPGIEKSILAHRAGLHQVKSGKGGCAYMCASWTAVCTMPNNLAEAQCRTARVVLGGGKGMVGYGWVSAEEMATHPNAA